MRRFLGSSWVSVTVGLREQTNVPSELILLCRDEIILSIPLCVHACSVASAVSNSLRRYGLYVAHQAPLSMGFSRQEYWSGLPYPPPGDFTDPGIRPASPALQADSLPLSYQGSCKTVWGAVWVTGRIQSSRRKSNMLLFLISILEDKDKNSLELLISAFSL